MPLEVDPLHKHREQRCERRPLSEYPRLGAAFFDPQHILMGGAMQSHGGSPGHSWATALLWIQGILGALVLARDAHEAWGYWLRVLAETLGR